MVNLLITIMVKTVLIHKFTMMRADQAIDLLKSDACGQLKRSETAPMFFAIASTPVLRPAGPMLPHACVESRIDFAARTCFGRRALRGSE
jgi:hypothetical protein